MADVLSKSILMQHLQHLAAVLLITAVPASILCAQQLSLPASAEIQRNVEGKVVAVHLAGKSKQSRLEVNLATVDAIAKFEHLERLKLWGTTVDDDAIKRLSGLRKVRGIDLTYTDVTGKSLRTISSFPNITSIRLEGCDVSDEQLAPLEEMPQVRMLYLGQTKVTDEGLKHLRNLKQLILLQLSDCDISDNGLASLGELPQIQHLWLSKTIRYGDDDRSRLTDRCIEYLLSLDTLLDLAISDSKITDAGIARLRDGLPKTKIRVNRKGVTYLSAKKE